MKSYKNYELSKYRAAKFYARIGNVMCPNLNNELIKFNAVGFKHLIRKVTRRSQKEQGFRFSLIPYAPLIISDPNSHVTYRRIESRGHKILHFWGLEKEFNGRILRVVIRKKGNGTKHFYSIMQHRKIASKVDSIVAI